MMLHPQRSPQTLYLFNQRKLSWQTIDSANWDTLNLPHLWKNQIFALNMACFAKVLFLEVQVSEQMPKEAYSHIAQSLAKLAPEILVLSFSHNRNAGVHLAFIHKQQTPLVHHLDLNFSQMSRFDQRIIQTLQTGSQQDFQLLFDLLNGQKLNHNFYQALRQQLRSLPTKNRNQYYALVDLVLKMTFLIFVQRKGWLNCDPCYLEQHMTTCDRKAMSIVTNFLTPLFARLEGNTIATTLDLGQLPKLGGGLFAFDRNALPPIPNQWCLSLYHMLVSQFSFSLFEANETRNVIGISPEVLGHVFENLLHNKDRKQQGTFYTPIHVARRQARAAFSAWVEHNQHSKSFEKKLTKIRILDPSCGSGTYLVACFGELLKLRLKTAPERQRYNGKLFELKREIMLNNLYGVDIHPMAIRLAEVRLWLNMIQDLEVAEPTLAPPLPNLQHHLRAGDFLLAHIPAQQHRIREWPKYKILERARKRFPNVAAKLRSQSLTHIYRLEDELIEWLDSQSHLMAVGQHRVLTKQPNLPGLGQPEPLCLPEMTKTDNTLHIAFCDVFLKGGFDLILGNPPWRGAATMPATMKRNIQQHIQLPAHLRLQGQIDLSLYFLVACISLLKKRGHLGMLIPNKFLQARYAATIRAWLGTFTTIDYLFDYGTDDKLVFNADTFPLALGFSHLEPNPDQTIHIEIHARNKTEKLNAFQRDLVQDGRPWSLHDIDYKRTKNWPVLQDFSYTAMRGVVTNDKENFTFLQKPANIPATRLRPLLRGRDIGPKRCHPSAFIYWPFAAGKRWWHELPQSEQRWLKKTGRLKPKEGTQLMPYRPRRFGPWVIAWKYLSATWQTVLIRSQDWVLDQTVYYLSFPDFDIAWRFFTWFQSPIAQRQVQGLSERGKTNCYFFYAHTVQLLKVPEDILTKPMVIPPESPCFFPSQASGIWPL